MPENVVLLSVDALRADHLTCYGYERPTSPFIDDFGENNIHFSNSYSAAPNTRESIPSLLSGHFSDESLKPNYKLNKPTIASFLSEEGYRTAAFHSNPYASRAFDMDRGFELYDDDLHLGKNKWIALFQRAVDKIRNKHYVRADTINKKSLDWMDEMSDDEPFFLWNHYMDVHGPYEPLTEYRELFEPDAISDRKAQSLYQRAVKRPDSISEAERETLINLYDAEIRYLDSCIESFIDSLRERGLLEDSLVVFTADHGDAFGEHGYYEHPQYLHDELIRVPIIVAEPGNDTTVSMPASTLDVLPTILDFVGVDAEVPGDSLLKISETPSAERVVFSQVRGENSDRNIRRFRAISSDSTAFGEFDLDSEEVSITDQDSESIGTQLSDHILERTNESEFKDSEEDIEDSEIERRLEALGYK